jgi:hypothetical protein
MGEGRDTRWRETETEKKGEGECEKIMCVKRNTTLFHRQHIEFEYVAF